MIAREQSWESMQSVEGYPILLCLDDAMLFTLICFLTPKHEDLWSVWNKPLRFIPPFCKRFCLQKILPAKDSCLVLILLFFILLQYRP